MRTWTFTLRLDTESRTPLYRQVARGIAQAIREGRLKTGDPLPGQRTLAEQLEVNRQTIAEAYRELALEGWISTRHGGGTFVERPPAQEAPPLPSLPSGPGFPIPTRTLAPTLPRRSPAPDLFQAGTGVPDLRLLPMAALSQAYHRALRAGGSLSLREGDPQGHPRLRESLAAMLASTRSIASTQASLQITSGGQLAFYLLARTLLQDGDAVAVEAVGRKEIWSSFQEAGAKLIPLPVDAHGVDIDALEQAATRTRLRLVYLTPQRQYPTTAVLSPERRGRLMDLARRHHLAILEHDDEAELHFEGPPTLPLAAQDPPRWCIHGGTVVQAVRARNEARLHPRAPSPDPGPERTSTGRRPPRRPGA